MKRNTYLGRHKSALIIHCLSKSAVVRVLLNRKSDLKLGGCGLGNLTSMYNGMVNYVPKRSSYKLR